MKFIVEGKLKLKNEERKFSKEIEANSENHAKEKVLSFFGSHIGVKRSRIEIETVKKVGE